MAVIFNPVCNPLPLTEKLFFRVFCFIEALAENVVETSRGTVIADGDVRISTIEHAMAALYAAEIDNCLIQVNAPEMPILDGSAGKWEFI